MFSRQELRANVYVVARSRSRAASAAEGYILWLSDIDDACSLRDNESHFSLPERYIFPSRDVDIVESVDSTYRYDCTVAANRQGR